MFYRTRTFRFIALSLALTLLIEMLAPTVVLALADGPSQPEFMGGGGGGNLVNPFTGAFSYSIPVVNVPGPNGVGYGINLNYSNNTSPESEASWVGLGWSLNAGAINRIKRGYPDDYKKSRVTYWRHARPNSTIRVMTRGAVEVTSFDLIPDAVKNLIKNSAGIDPGNPQGSVGMSDAFTLEYNNQTGFDWFFDLGVGGMGLNANLGVSETGVELDGDFDPVALIGSIAPYYIGSPDFWNGVSAIYPYYQLYKQHKDRVNEFHHPTRVPRYSSHALTFSGAVEGDILPNIGYEAGLTGFYARLTSILKEEEDAYGYLYTDEVMHQGEAMDYYVEREDSYKETDRHLPIPFSNADYFAVSGAGVGGTFRPYQRAQGHFRPATEESRTVVGHANIEFHVGEEIGFGGAGAGGGRVKLLTRGWKSNGLSFGTAVGDGEQKFFRFLGDWGGSMLDASDDPVQLSPYGNEDQWQTSDGSDADVWSLANNGERVGRTTYVGYNTNSAVLDGPPFNCFYSNGGVRYRSFSRRSSVINNYVKRDDAALRDGLGEFSVVGGNGMTYVYGLPVYSRDEMSMSYGLYGLNKVQDLEHNFLAYKHVAKSNYEDNDNLNGMESPDPYSTGFLLTEIVSPDYVDRTNNGPTADDLGGYVVFNYKSTAGTYDKDDPDKSSWYKWRSPYRGTFYGRNSLSDPYDDLGSFASGYKEIYYLESIETKTHKAIFHTSPRDDAFEAHHDEAVAGADDQATTADGNGNPKVHKLDKVELWSKDADGQTTELLSTTYFEYDYSLCQGVPNSASNGGKLTLKRLWFEYEGAVNARISPYEFGYEYRKSTDYPSEIQNNSLYDNIINHGDQLTEGSGSQQNPDYSEFDIDRWGNYQKDGENQYDKYRQWLDQSSVANKDFDPAPWQLKWIKLPSGGEVHIQYEQNDYRYVQHRDAMVMAPLKSENGDYNFEVDLAAIGVGLNASDTENDQEGEALEALLKKQFGDKDGQFVGDREYIYYRLLYGLLASSTPDLEKCTSEYFTGYAAVTDVDYDPASNKLYVQIGNSSDDRTRPEKKCEEFYRAVRQGILTENCGSPQNSIDDGADSEKTVISAIFHLFETVFNVIVEVTAPSFGLCEDINVTESYLRIPTIKDKKGGGGRVKRILTSDPGLEDEDAALYGVEYFYQSPDGRSSGVATTEPVAGREENGLVHLSTLANNANDRDTIITGKSMRQLELPVGESLFPAASVGYSRVVARNIHTGKSAPGFTLYQYYTARDYPFDLRNMQPPGNGTEQQLPAAAGAMMSEPTTSIATDRSPSFPIELVVYGNAGLALNATQGFRFIINKMHGQARSVAKYIGTFHPGSADDLQDASMVEHVEFEYFQPWEPIPLMDGPSEEDIYEAYPGKVVEVVTESREVVIDMSDANLQVDAGVYFGFLFPLPFGSFSGRYQVDKQKLRTHVTSKVIDYPVILKSVTATKDNIVDRTEYAGFDPESGLAVLLKKSDGYEGLMLSGSPQAHNGTYYSVAIPAWRHYANFGQMAKTQGLLIRSDMATNESDGNGGLAFDKRFIRVTSGSDYTDQHYLNVRSLRPRGSGDPLNGLVTGDMIELTAPQIESDGSYAEENNGDVITRPLGVYHVGTIGAGRIELLPVSYSVTSNEQEVRDVWIEIIKTGRNNRVGASVGGFTTYGMPPTSIEKPVQ